MNLNPQVRIFDRKTNAQKAVFDSSWFESFSFVLDMEGGCKECDIAFLRDPQNYIEGFDKVMIQLDPTQNPQYIGEIIEAPFANVNHYKEPENVTVDDFSQWYPTTGTPVGFDWYELGGGATPPTPSASFIVQGWNAALRAPGEPLFIPSGSAYSLTGWLQISAFTGFNSIGDWLYIYKLLPSTIDLTDKEMEIWFILPLPTGTNRYGKLEFRLYDNAGRHIAIDFQDRLYDELYDTGNADYINVWISDEIYSDRHPFVDISQIQQIGVYFERGLTPVPGYVLNLDYIHYYPNKIELPSKIKYISDKVYSGYGYIGKAGDEIYDANWPSDTAPEDVFEDIADSYDDVDDYDSDPTGQEHRFYFPQVAMDQAFKTVVEMGGQTYWNIGQNQDSAYLNTPRVLAEMRNQPDVPRYYWTYGEQFSKVPDGRLLFANLGNVARLRTGQQIRSGTNYATTKQYRQSASILGERTKPVQLAAQGDSLPYKFSQSSWNQARRNAWPTYHIPDLNLLYTDEFVWPGELATLNIDGDEIDVRIKLVRYTYSAENGLQINVVFGEVIRGDPLVDQLRQSWITLKEAQELTERNL